MNNKVINIFEYSVEFTKAKNFNHSKMSLYYADKSFEMFETSPQLFVVPVLEKLLKFNDEFSCDFIKDDTYRIHMDTIFSSIEYKLHLYKKGFINSRQIISIQESSSCIPVVQIQPIRDKWDISVFQRSANLSVMINDMIEIRKFITTGQGLNLPINKMLWFVTNLHHHENGIENEKN